MTREDRKKLFEFTETKYRKYKAALEERGENDKLTDFYLTAWGACTEICELFNVSWLNGSLEDGGI